jgi:hypothetical protein
MSLAAQRYASTLQFNLFFFYICYQHEAVMVSYQPTRWSRQLRAMLNSNIAMAFSA